VAEQERPVPSRLVYLNGLVAGFSIPSAFAIGASARADAEPTVGPLAGAVLQWVATIAWMLLIVAAMRWFSTRSWVRAWYAAAPEWRS